MWLWALSVWLMLLMQSFLSLSLRLLLRSSFKALLLRLLLPPPLWRELLLWQRRWLSLPPRRSFRGSRAAILCQSAIPLSVLVRQTVHGPAGRCLWLLKDLTLVLLAAAAAGWPAGAAAVLPAATGCPHWAAAVLTPKLRQRLPGRRLVGVRA